MRKIKLMAMFIAVLLFGCEEELTDSAQLNTENQINDVASLSSSEMFQQTNASDNGLIKLGKKLENPYALDNMTKSYNYLVSQKVTPKVKPYLTHFYIKITPRDHKDLALVEQLVIDDKIFISPVPIDYEIEQNGEWYIDPNPIIQPCRPELTPLYTAIPVKSTYFPKDMQVEVLEKLYLPSEDEGEDLLEATALFFTDNLEGVEVYNLSKSSPDVQVLGLFGRKWRPRGIVTVQTGTQDAPPTPPTPPTPPGSPGCGEYLLLENNQPQYTANWYPTGSAPLEEAMISVVRWFKWSRVYTDNNGNFTSGKKFRAKKVKIRAKWRGYTATIRGNVHEYAGIGVYDKLGEMRKGQEGKVFNIPNSDQHKWLKATAHNAMVHNNQYYEANNLSGRISHTNVWIVKGDKHSGGTLMWKEYPSLKNLILNTPFSCWWFPYVGFAYDILTIGSPNPDFVYQLGGIQDTEAIERIVFHEAAHYAHAKYAGSSYWYKVSDGEVRNICYQNQDPYSDGTNPNTNRAEIIGVAEGWGNFMEHKMADDLHNRTNYRSFARSGNPTIHYDDYWQFTVPMAVEQDDFNRWFMTGIFNDLNDNRNDQIRLLRGSDGFQLGLGVDNFQLDGGNISTLFNSLKGENPNEVRQRLVNANAGQATQINQMFTNYGY